MARNPGESVDREGILPMRCTKVRAAARVSGEVWRPEIISTPRWMGTGFMKCVLMTRDAAERSLGSVLGVVAAAILVMEMEEVFVARMACAGQMRANWAKMESLRERISGTASMTKSTLWRSSIFVVDPRRARVAAASDSVRRPLETPF